MRSIQEAIQDDLLGEFVPDQFAGEQSDHVPQGIVVGRREGQDLGQGVKESAADLAGELVGAAQEHHGLRVVLGARPSVADPELLRLQACGTRLMPDVVVRPAAHQRDALLGHLRVGGPDGGAWSTARQGLRFGGVEVGGIESHTSEVAGEFERELAVEAGPEGQGAAEC